MASRNSTRSSSARTTQEPDTTSAQDTAAQVSRQQLTLLTQAAAAACRNAAAWQQAQLGMLQRSGALYQELAGKIERATGPAEFLSIQTGLLMSGWQEALQLSQDLMRIGTGMQSELNSTAGAGSQHVAPTGLNAVMPMMQAWQSLFTAPMSGTSSRPH
jgi:hypothetical protein